MRFLKKLLFIFNILTGLACIIGYGAPYISPNDFWPIAFFGLALPYFLLLNLLFLFVWAFSGSAKFLLPVLILALGYKVIPNLVQVQLKSNEIDSKSLKVMSFNVRVFDLYMWSEEKTTRNKIFDFLREEDPDILCLQEFYNTTEKNPSYEFKTLDTLIKILSAKNYHVYYTTKLRGTDNWGVITFSKYPILDKGVVPFQFKDDNACIYTDISTKDKTIRVYNTHLASIRLKKHDYKAMQEIKNNDYSENFGNEFELINKVRYGFERRAKQAESIRSSINKSPYPVILCGDFNDSPSSYAYETIKGNLKDAFIETGSGLGQTYIGEFPSFRIDYILFDKSITTKHFKTHQKNLSDHKPISTLFDLN